MGYFRAVEDQQCKKLKSYCPVQMNICAFRLIAVEYDPVDFISTYAWLFLVVEILNHKRLINYA